MPIYRKQKAVQTITGYTQLLNVQFAMMNDEGCNEPELEIKVINS
jgi:hypothetical protein